MMLIISIIVLYTLFFAIYLEINPSLTNIWYRTGSDGEKHIYLSNYFYFIMKPFTMKELWYPEFWDCNFWIGLIIILIIYLFF